MISSPHNPFVKHLVKLREDKKYRYKVNSLLVAGFTLVDEISRFVQPKKIIVTSLADAPAECEIVQVSYALLKKITGLPSPEPIAAEFPLPSPSSLSALSPILALDAIRDPGNLGTLMRTAVACGWQGIFLLPTCVDPFHEKVIRSSRATPFRIPWKIGSWEELEALKKKEGLTIYIADLSGKEISSLQPAEKFLLLMSNESQGVSARGASSGERITITMRGEMESLNVAVAGGILMYTLVTPK
jgi:TrmH family RNA methyltransferase